MRTIHKYPIPLEAEFEIELPSGAVVLCVGEQRESPMLWALVNPDAPMYPRNFVLGLTGHPLREDAPGELEYRGTFSLAGGGLRGPFVGHVFEVVPF